MASRTAASAGQPQAAGRTDLARKQRSLWGDARYRLYRNRAAMAGLAVIAIAALLALLAPLVAPHDPIRQDTPNALMEPMWTGSKFTLDTYLLGSDQLGRDILSRLIWSARISMIIGFVPVTLIFLVGATVGMSAGFYGKWVDTLLMRIVDIIYAFPDLLFLIIIMATLRGTFLGDLLGGLVLMFVAIAVVGWVGMARLVRGQVLSLKEKEFVEAARAMGATDARIMFRHLFPNTLAPIIVSIAFGVPSAILAEATLSFLGIGIKPPTPTWGVMINEGFVVFSTTPWPVLLPAFCISLVMLAFTFVGDGLRDALDPRQRAS